MKAYFGKFVSDVIPLNTSLQFGPWKDGSSDYAFVCWRRWQQWHVCRIDGGASMGKLCKYKGDIIKLG